MTGDQRSVLDECDLAQAQIREEFAVLRQRASVWELDETTMPEPPVARRKRTESARSDLVTGAIYGDDPLLLSDRRWFR